MSVYYLHIPSKRFKFCIKRRRTIYLVNWTVYLETVIIKKYTKIIKLLMRCEHCRFPYLSFFCLTVAKYRPNTIFISKTLSR